MGSMTNTNRWENTPIMSQARRAREYTEGVCAGIVAVAPLLGYERRMSAEFMAIDAAASAWRDAAQNLLATLLDGDDYEAEREAERKAREVYLAAEKAAR